MRPNPRRALPSADGQPPATGGPDIADLAICIEDARLAALDPDPGPDNPLHFNSLIDQLTSAVAAFSPLYRQEYADPFVAKLKGLGEEAFNDILFRDPNRAGDGLLMLDMAQAILQRRNRVLLRATNAFQEVVSDLYDGFLSAEDRRRINPPDGTTTPPLVKWGNPLAGPYTWPIDATSAFGAGNAVVNLPPANARKGIMAWAALSHETGGHDISHANRGMQSELTDAVYAAVEKATPGLGLGDYWASRVDETSADVMGILNMGPAPAIGLIAYFRGLNAAYTGQAALSAREDSADPHPLDVMRGYLAAETVNLLSFSDHDAWSKIVTAETDKDAVNINLADIGAVSQGNAKTSARAVAEAIANSKLDSLGGHALSEIQDWTDHDEGLVAWLRPMLSYAGDLSPISDAGVYAAHVVAAGCMEALSNGANIGVIFGRMQAALDALFDKNPSWGPLFVRHPGDITRDFAYRRKIA